MQTVTRIETIETLIKSGLETEIAIDLVKSTFSQALCNELNLVKVVAPIAVEENTGINDDLNGVERAICFPIADIQGTKGVVVQSLAKWKRLRLAQLEMKLDTGILTDMHALRPDEKLSPIHSIYVDQWDWEKVIAREYRSIDTLKETVRKIYSAILKTEREVCRLYPQIEPILPKSITFIHAQELLDMFPDLTPKEREDSIAKVWGAVFIIGIGSSLTDGKPHDGRAPDYDDWSTPTEEGYFGLNGDIIVWNPLSNRALELSSMGIRVDKESLIRQLGVRGCMDKLKLMYHQMLVMGQLPQSIGGGIGQSRLCMYLLRKRHIGEVQVGIWPATTRLAYGGEGIDLV
jgi:aspartate--ammonia ligase